MKLITKDSNIIKEIYKGHYSSSDSQIELFNGFITSSYNEGYDTCLNDLKKEIIMRDGEELIVSNDNGDILKSDPITGQIFITNFNEVIE